MNLEQLKKTNPQIPAQAVQDEPREFKVIDFPSIKEISYDTVQVQPKDEYDTVKVYNVWEFRISGKWQPVTKWEFESDTQTLIVSGLVRENENPENFYSKVAIAVIAGNGHIMVKPNFVGYKAIVTSKRHDEHEEQPKEYVQEIKAYYNDILPVTEQGGK